MSALTVLDAMPAEEQSTSAGSQSEADHAYLEHLSQRVRVLRTARQFTQDQLAERAGLDRTHLRRRERRQHDVTVLVLVQLARALGVPTTAVLP